MATQKPQRKAAVPVAPDTETKPDAGIFEQTDDAAIIAANSARAANVEQTIAANPVLLKPDEGKTQMDMREGSLDRPNAVEAVAKNMRETARGNQVRDGLINPESMYGEDVIRRNGPPPVGVPTIASKGRNKRIDY